MGRKTKNNIVIVCEGTETEYDYFTGLKNYLGDSGKYYTIRIVPTKDPEEIQGGSRQRKNRKLNGDRDALRYYEQVEESRELYDKYHKQPTRYVREAQLFLKDNVYTEAWAVFDNDDFPDLESAFKLASTDDNLNIAYSSISFEEWFLHHFERNAKVFDRSECKADNKTIDCNKDKGCRGEHCIAGRLRVQGYLPDYKKNNKDDKKKDRDDFFIQTRSHLEQARINAAWLRHLQDGPIYERNPYTDVDRLVSRLLSLDKEYVWVRLGEEFKYNGATILVEKEKDMVRINTKTACFIGKDNLINTDLSGNEKLLLKKNLMLTNGMSEWLPITAPFLRLDSGANSFFMDLN